MQFAVLLNPRALISNKGKGIRVHPEHIHEALRKLAGIAEHPYSKKFPLGVPDQEKLNSLWG